MGKRLTEDQIERFQRDGVVFPVRAYTTTAIAQRMEWLQAIEDRRAGRLPPALNAKAHLLIPFLWEMVHDPVIVDAVEDLLGPDLLCWGTSFISKRGPDERHVTWHQDATHWHLTRPRAVTAWVAFTPSTRANGCVRAIPGSNQVAVPHRDSHDRLNMLGMREEVTIPLDADRAVDLVLEPGEMSLHDALIIHGSEPNRSNIRRTGFAIRYIPADVAQTAGLRNSATLVRGRDHGHFDLEVAPEDLFHPDAMRRHAQVLRRGMEVIFGTAKAGRGDGLD
ncbi:MAG: phytanoyl-CoA dioxygenase family protein [Acetobacteraceae bacterium]